ncbi:hypothetical protein [Marisediminicola sp. LYQ134]|uniref:hypothetical protein n=1 Tax=unclassified Marisediminicola TaxID=2618316 RepID=UPI003983964A
MTRRRLAPRTATIGSALVILSAGLLTGCTPPSATADPPPSAPAAPEVTPTPSPSIVEPDTTLFTVSAKVRAIDNTTVDISLTGFEPVPSTDPRAADLVEMLVDGCRAMDAASVSDVTAPVSAASLAEYGSSLMRLDYTATPEGHTFFAPVDLQVGSPYFGRIVSGENVAEVVTNTTCTGRYQLTGSGEATAVSNYESGRSVPDDDQWIYGHYGFTVPFESGATIEACSVEVSDLAAESVGDVPGWEPGSDRTAISCGIGWLGD